MIHPSTPPASAPATEARGQCSPEAAAIRRTLVPETIEPGRTAADERREWDAASASDRLVAGATEAAEEIAGLPCLWLRPVPPAAPRRPVIVYLHGGGLTAGSLQTHRRFASSLCVATCCPVLLVGYNLVPEHPVEQIVDEIVNVLVNVGADFDHVVVAGDSSGAGLALSATISARDRGLPMPVGLVAISGVFDSTLTSPSIDTAPDPQLSRSVLEHWKSTIASAVDVTSPIVSPLFDDLAELPPLLLLAGADEAWRDDSLRLSAAVSAAGGEATVRIFDGMWHVWPMHRDFPEAAAALTEVADFVDAIALP